MERTRTHAWQRVDERMAECGFDADTRDKVFQAARLLAAQSGAESEALRLLILPEQVGESWGDRSNGDTVIAIVRNRRLATVMLRRSTQPFTPEALDVKRVTIIA